VPTPETPETPVTPPKPPETPTVKLPEGGVIEAKDERTGVDRSATVLQASYPNGAEITIQGGLFKAKWDGKADFDLGTIPAGSYRTNVTPVGQDKIRSKSFEVVGKKKCAFKFDSTAKEWTGGCT
jgi:hypothetical protein